MFHYVYNFFLLFSHTFEIIHYIIRWYDYYEMFFYLKWFGQTELRNQFLGKLVIVHLSCRNNKLSTDKDDSKRTFCVAVKITNSPAEHVQCKYFVFL